jgi:hypothetical protein
MTQDDIHSRVSCASVPLKEAGLDHYQRFVARCIELQVHRFIHLKWGTLWGGELSARIDIRFTFYPNHRKTHGGGFIWGVNKCIVNLYLSLQNVQSDNLNHFN